MVAPTFNPTTLPTDRSEFEDDTKWNSIEDGLEAAVKDKIILLYKYIIPSDNYEALVVGIFVGSVCIVSDRSFDIDSSVGPTGTSAVILTPSTTCAANLFAKGWNWDTGSKFDKSAYRSKLAGIIAAVTILDILVWRYAITTGSVTIALDGKSDLNESAGDHPLSVDQISFDYLQVIRNWISQSTLQFKLKYVVGHQTNYLRNDQLDWWAKQDKGVDQAEKTFMAKSTTCQTRRRQIHRQPKLYLEKWSLSINGPKFQFISRDRLYIELYDTTTVQFWHEKDNVPLDPSQILWEESRLMVGEWRIK